MPGNSSSRCAAMTCSSGTNRSPSGITTKRGSSGGTLTRAKRRSSVVGVADDDAQVERQVGDVRERVAGVDGERREHREDAVAELDGGPFAVVVVQLAPAWRSRCPSAARPAHSGPRNDLVGPIHQRAGALAAPLPAARPPSGRRGSRPLTPAAIWSLSPATRTWKNSSRFWLKMARNLTRSSSGVCGSSARASTRALKSSQDSSRLMYRCAPPGGSRSAVIPAG